ncbi:MAG: PilZ domain-containing protein [Geobacter sp.]|nr:PilZ domain-containing protein [Geobacter sp.]
MRKTFHIVSIQDGKQDLEAILHILREIKAGRLKNDLKLLNYYHEVPISYAAKIETIDTDCMEVTAHQAQAVVLGLQKQVLLTSTLFPQGLGVHCFVEYVNVKNSFAVLGRFAYASIRAERRGAVRVSVDGFLSATYTAETQSLSGRADDISVSGVAIYNQQPSPTGISDSGILQLSVQGTELQLPATLIKSLENDDGFVHTFRFEPDKNADKVISQYIYCRQVEIIRQLKEQFL